MTNKHPILPDRIRRIPQQFSWVDGRLVREHHLDGCSHGAAALYLFLVTVADARGLSYYADTTICRRLNMDSAFLGKRRQELIHDGLIAYRKPLYQVLELGPRKIVAPDQRNQVEDTPQSLGQILKNIMEAD
jgi:hypothetical protein